MAAKSFLLLVALCGSLAPGCSSDDDEGAMDFDEFDVPPIGEPLQTFLQAGNYEAFPAESAVHAPIAPSPHGQVRTFINPKLDASLAAGNAAHPVGSAAVKELYDAEGTRTGWAVSVKTDADSAGGEGWYWFEVLGGDVVIDGNGVAACTGCHGSSGVDYFSSPYPLQ